MSTNTASVASANSFDKIVDALRHHDSTVKYTGSEKAMAQCPAHEDGRPSLSITWSGGDNPTTLMYCFAGCDNKDIMEAIGLRLRDLYDKDSVVYAYNSPVSGWAERFVLRDPETKAFTQSIKKKSDKTPLYRRDLLRKARMGNLPVYLVEGEKDADALIYLGSIATTAPQGAANFDKCEVSELAGLNVVAIADRDEAGQAWARQVFHHAGQAAASLTFKHAAVGKDVSDHIAAQLPLDELADPPAGFPYETDQPRADGYKKNGQNGQDESGNGRHLKVTPLSEIAIKATRWLWEDERARWIPMNSLVGLAGREGVGKSTWCAHLIAKLTKGELPGDSYGKPKGAVIVTTEDDWEATIKPRLLAAGADMNRVYKVMAVPAEGLEEMVMLPNDIQELAKVIRDYDVGLVILDPLLTLVNPKLDSNKDPEVRRALEPVVKLAQDTRASFIGLIHVNKSTEGDLMNRVMGSRAIGAVARGVLFCASYKPIEDMVDEDGEGPFFAAPNMKRSRFVFDQIKNNLAAKAMHSIEYHMDAMVVGYDDDAEKDIEGSYLVTDRVVAENVEDIVLEQEKARKGAQTKGSKAERWLIGYLAGKGEVPTKAIVKAGREAGFSRDSLYRARRDLEEIGRLKTTNLSTVPKSSTWKLLVEEDMQ